VDAAPPVSAELRHALQRRLVQLVTVVLAQGALLFVASGQFRWPMAWLYLGSYVALVAANAAILLPRDPELIAERGRIGENTKGWDKALIVLMTVFSFALLIVAGLDRRFGWTPTLGSTVLESGFVLYLMGFILVSWAMASNRFFSSVVRIQLDRAHTVAAGGPYRFVRHPGYLGMMVSIQGVALLLGSLWGLVPAGLYTVTLIVRTALEDRMLKRELAGYQDYAARVRHRLLPEIW
jgi:protein-S-isoprenylcysteine O-methyltransferase Ste14